MQPVRLPVIFDDGDRIALDKPSGVLVLADNWYPRFPVLVEAIRYQAERGKPELQRLSVGESGLYAIYSPDPEISGVIWMARTSEAAEKLKDDFGAERMRFVFHFVAASSPPSETVECDLPLARHFHERRMVVSHSTGKQAKTRFECLERMGRYALWQAESALPRRHQVLLHALESGISVLGDTVYANNPLLYLSQIKRNYRISRRSEEESPLHSGPAVHLVEVALGDGTVSTAPPGKSFVNLLRQLRQHA